MSELKLMNGNTERAAIRISIPFNIAMNEDSMKKSLSKLAEFIGHQGCFSGVDCIFQLQRDLVIDEKLSIKSIAEGDPDGNPSINASANIKSSSNLVTAMLSKKEMMSIDAIHKVVSELSKIRLNCPACHSGYDFMFKTEVENMRFG